MKKDTRDKGAAMIIMAIVMLVLTSLALSLMLCAFSFFQTAGRKTDSFQVKEMAVSLSKLLETELCGYVNNSYNDIGTVDDELVAYLKNNMFQDSWSCTEVGADSEPRYFSIENLPEDLCDDLTVMIYYRYFELLDNGDVDRSSTELICVVSCKKGKEKASVISKYSLDVIGDSDSDNPEAEKWIFSLMLME